MAVIGASTAIGALTSGISAAATSAATTTAVTLGKEATKQVVTNAVTELMVSGTSAIISTGVKSTVTNLIKGESADLGTMSQEMFDSGKSGIMYNGISQGLSLIDPNLPDAVGTIVEDVWPTFVEIYNELNE